VCAHGTQCERLGHKRVHKDHIHAFFGVSARSIVRESVRMRESRRGISKAFCSLSPMLTMFLSFLLKTPQASRQIIEKYYSRLTLDFATNKRIADEIAIIPSKRLRNKIAGFTTHLMKRIQRGPVRGISLKLQEEERERRMDFIPDESALQTDSIEVDRDTMDMLKSMNMGNLPGVSIGHRGRHHNNRR